MGREEIERERYESSLTAQSVVQGFRSYLISVFGNQGTDAEYQAETVDNLTKINLLLTGMTNTFKSIKVTFTFEANDNG